MARVNHGLKTVVGVVDDALVKHFLVLKKIIKTAKLVKKTKNQDFSLNCGFSKSLVTTT